MGFGLLFIGYFLAYVGALTPISSFTFVLGSAIIMYALYKLANQNKMFIASCITTFVLFVISMIIVIMYVFGKDSGVFYNILTIIRGLISPILNLGILVAIYIIAKDVELPKIQAKAIINLIVVSIYLIFDVITIFVSSEKAIQRLGMVCVVSQIIFTVFTLITIFNCYVRICYEEDKDMSNNSSGIKFFDFLNKMLSKAMNKNRKNKGDK